jgi:hypothetical protein
VVDTAENPERSRIGRESAVESLWMSVLPMLSADLARWAVSARSMPAPPTGDRRPSPDPGEVAVGQGLETAGAHDRTLRLRHPDLHAVVERQPMDQRVGVLIRRLVAENRAIHEAHRPNVSLFGDLSERHAIGQFDIGVEILGASDQ